MPCSCQWCIFIWVSAEALSERSFKGGTPKRSRFWSRLPCRCCHWAMQRVWPTQFPADGEMDDVLKVQTQGGKQGPTRSCQHSGFRHVPLYKSPVLSLCCQLELTPPQQPASLTYQGCQPKGGFPTSTQAFCPFMEPNQFPSPQLNDLGSTGREMAPDLPFRQGSQISRDNLLSQWPNIGWGN